MDFFLENILYFAVFITILSFVFFYLRRNRDLDVSQNISSELTQNEIEIKLRAYERLTLFLERIEPVGMINRLELHNEKIEKIPSILIKNIVSEYEYNISQQIYVSDGLWKILELVKNKMINCISNCANSVDNNSTDDLVKKLLKHSNENTLIIKRAQKILKQEISYISQPR
ncbi:MAG: hypothetical protein CMP49_05775 [Flavobacteriales bacterium]|nr:hypothetical protein [Flavobacteriales bacterium]|tara:strand:- start:2885 stop:3400 length:516 start_codon:yes stop_codon:yes gene_type:complete